jgi:hypothetical protein
MKHILAQLEEIEKEHPEFFTDPDKKIVDYITKGKFNSGVFINNDLPLEIIAKIRKVIDNAF